MHEKDRTLIELLKNAIRDVTLKEPGDITAETGISELELDSVAMMELIGILEETFSLHVADEDITELRRVSDILNLIRDREPAPQPKKDTRWSNDASWHIPDFPEVRNLERRLDEIAGHGLQIPYFQAHEGISANRTVVGGVEMINFSSYNYLGFSGHPDVIAAAKDAMDRYGTSVSASRLVSGERPVHRELEEGIARHIGVDDAVAFVSGHATNVTTIGHLFDRHDLILHDALCHDSILQGIGLSGAKRISFRHGDTTNLDMILARTRDRHRRALICTEGLFSMDGDLCDLPALIELKKRHRCNLFVDEAHSMGVLGPSGRGIAHHYAGVDPRDVDLWMGTLSKSFASCGGYIAGSIELVRYLKYTAPGFLYSVGMPASNAAAALKSLKLMQRHPEIVERLHRNSRLFLAKAR
ncbi:MAG TPA: aminotransferase class I/II-fold pyridoxal phosphate-dependent enzyme, partial [Acidobacteriota bacterium]|nr:aminotransferase class I/II-fold pyridoxal phosphate-dependent enzyme [Acidobacteriota bacterium]